MIWKRGSQKHIETLANYEIKERLEWESIATSWRSLYVDAFYQSSTPNPLKG